MATINELSEKFINKLAQLQKTKTPYDEDQEDPNVKFYKDILDYTIHGIEKCNQLPIIELKQLEVASNEEIINKIASLKIQLKTIAGIFNYVNGLFERTQQK
jgi:hypothetical protein